MGDAISIASLIERASHGDELAWNQIVQRYAPLVRSVCQRFHLTSPDAEDVAGAVWLRLVACLTSIREPAALPGWLATTTRRECLTLVRHRNRQIPSNDQVFIAEMAPTPEAWLLTEESRHVLRGAVAQLPDRDRHLLSMLFTDPPTPYATISAILDMPVGAIGPTRQRCLARLRRSPDLAALASSDHRYSIREPST